ncbi:hypothetical protein SAMN05444682_101601 [Parapedobacter indicus]|uniref:Uncharacterized protein n=1 Tax=Parapedobacter indicus TaxID=1477437 RepID=A0A1I3DR65_9SPHI|nr:hypothetical protein CLV26_101615 [Parapedobacter indicus]SFH89237.1 hypothetical protein SAMN05444682_101601 [Parapedobacter indicus]
MEKYRANSFLGYFGTAQIHCLYNLHFKLMINQKNE